VLAGLALTACSENAVVPSGIKPGEALLAKAAGGADEQYVIIGSGGKLPSDLTARVAAAGGTLLRTHEEIGVAVARGGASLGTGALGGGIDAVVPDMLIEQQAPTRVVDLDDRQMAIGEGGIDAQVVGDPNTNGFYFLQWGPKAVNAPEAWAAGHRGANVRVAILDGGLHHLHSDLVGKVDVAKSTSFACARPPQPPPPVQPPPPAPPVPPTPWPGPPETCKSLTTFNSDHGTFWHGTHVAGIVAAADNTIGVIGIAPDATLIGVKVLDGGTGWFSWAIDGIMYAARPLSEGGAGAHVINMSLGALVDKGKPGNSSDGLRALLKAIDRATSYAWDRGVTVVAAAGNEETNLDDRRYVSLPAQNTKVISVAATAPLAWAYGANNPAHPLATEFWRQASYTNSGKAGVDLAAPGGDFAHPTNELCTVFRTPTTGTRTNCWVFDMYLSTSRGSLATNAGGYSWAAGTSMASPVTAGIAALIIRQSGGTLTPAGVKAKLQQGATDLGKSGNDEVYGHGWVNALGSVSR
jgi:subtilisin family serine protease